MLTYPLPLRTMHFTGREREVCELLLEAKCDKEIAAALGISTHTGRFHLSNIMRKLGVSSRMEVVIALLKAPAIPPPRRT